MKREYRGQRSVTAIADYIRQQNSDPIRTIESLEELKTIDVSMLSWNFERKPNLQYFVNCRKFFITEVANMAIIGW